MTATLARLRAAFAYRFNLRQDQASFEEIDRTIRGGVEIRGTNLWVLMLAIFIASIGLNVNSTAVIIGAMLISPLMGPIMGVGYGAGINDYQLIEKSLANLLVSFLIALFTSTIYFLASPLSFAQSELLARTSPTIWDVLIALCGCLAGIIASTRKEKSNVIPGVAIATALMPPLCTAGYGIAHASAKMFFGAFYLFFINCVFIALSTLMMVGYIRPPHRKFVDSAFERKVRRTIYILVLATVVPSIYLAYGLVTREVFNYRANAFIREEMVFPDSFVAKQKISPENRLIDVTLVGHRVDEKHLAEISTKLPGYRLPNTRLVVHQAVIQELDEASLKKTLLSEVLSANTVAFNDKDKQIERREKRIGELQEEVVRLKAQQAVIDDAQKDREKMVRELSAQYPQASKIAIAMATDSDGGKVLLVDFFAQRAPAREERKRLVAWLKVRAGVEAVRFSVSKP